MLLSVLAIVVGLPFVLAGILCTLTVIGAIVGLPLIALGALPLFLVQRRRGSKIRDWEMRGRIMDNEEEIPWET